MSIKTTFAKSKYIAFGLLVLGSSVFGVFAQTQKAQAAGETYAWATNQSVYSVSADGGQFGSGVQFQGIPLTNPLPTMLLGVVNNFTFSGSGVTCTMSAALNGDGSPNTNQDLSINVQLSDGTTGVLQMPAWKSGFESSTNTSFCANSQNEWNAVRTYFNGRQVPITGTPPFNTNKAAQQVVVTVDTLTAGSGTATQATVNICNTTTSCTGSAIIQTAQTKASVSSAGAFLTASFSLPQGGYTACAIWSGGSGCTNFTKGTGPAAVTIKNLSTAVTINPIVNLCFSGTASTSYTLGPYNFALEDSSGNKVLTGQTNSKTLPPASNDSSAATATSRICVPGNYSLNSSGSGVLDKQPDPSHAEDQAIQGTASSTDPTLEKGFNSNPGNYKICLTDINVCQTATNMVFNLGQNDSNTLVADSTNNEAATKPSCESTNDDNGWLICPIFNGVSGATDWAFTNLLQPFLYTSPISTSANDDSFKAWSTFRVYGDIFLVIALLIIVFGEAITGGIADAYRVQKLPRVLAAAILINSSVYIVAALVDITNVAGATIGHIITAPIDLSFQPDPAVGNVAIAGGILGLIFSAGGIATVLVGIFTLKAALIKSALWVAMFMLLPIVIAVLTIFFVLIIRKGLILALILFSPLAFAFYCLPNTEKWFRKWWDTLFKALLIYPAVTAIFAIADVLAVSIMKANGTTADSIKNGTLFTGSGTHGPIMPHVASVLGVHGGTFADTPGNAATNLLTVVLGFVAAVLVETVIKGGGTIIAVRDLEQFSQMAYNALDKGGKKLHGMTQGKKELNQKRLNGQMVQTRERAHDLAGKVAASDNFVAKRTGRFLQNRIQGGGLRNVYGESAALNAETSKRLKDISDHGRDDESRALAVNKAYALENDRVGGRLWRTGSNGGREFRTAGGAWVTESNVDAAHNRDGGNVFALQSAIAYEMNKANTDEEKSFLQEMIPNLNYKTGINDGQLNGALKGAGFQMQNEYKHAKVVTDEDGNRKVVYNRGGLLEETAGKKGPYELAQKNNKWWEEATAGFQEASVTYKQLDEKRRRPGGLSAEEQQVYQKAKRDVGLGLQITANLERGGALYGAGGDQMQMLALAQARAEAEAAAAGTTIDVNVQQPGQGGTEGTISGTIPIQNTTGGAAPTGSIPQQRRPDAMVGQGGVISTSEKMVLFARAVHEQFPDLSHDVAETNAFIEAAPENRVDVVVGSGRGPSSTP